MSGTRKTPGVVTPPAEEDPNAAVVCTSPPCFMHELDPSCLGYLSREDARALLDAVLAAEWGGAAPDEARLRAALRRRLEALGGRPGREPATLGQTSRGDLDQFASMIREALPRIHDDALGNDLGRVLGASGQGAPHRGGPQSKG